MFVNDTSVSTKDDFRSSCCYGNALRPSRLRLEHCACQPLAGCVCVCVVERSRSRSSCFERVFYAVRAGVRLDDRREGYTVSRGSTS